MKSLIIYHSVQGNTEKVAITMSKIIRADIYKINSKQRSNGNLTLMSGRILHQMINGSQFNQAIRDLDLLKYDRIYIGSPCWYYQVTAPVKNLIRNVSFENKEVGLFVTHGGDIGRTVEKFKAELIEGRFIGAMDFFNVNSKTNEELECDIRSSLERLRIVEM